MNPFDALKRRACTALCYATFLAVASVPFLLDGCDPWVPPEWGAARISPAYRGKRDQ